MAINSRNLFMPVSVSQVGFSGRCNILAEHHCGCVDETARVLILSKRSAVYAVRLTYLPHEYTRDRVVSRRAVAAVRAGLRAWADSIPCVLG
ncbi:hypothetical protein EVAR_31969_1 [Eumeta japonica]|uniref:Uncharacterized protein n=1 Tax=Eumeta variegata TaxID=151549 RepID=A0A4C1VTH5_EUMVA|nr:hypothetical protein EVAR_31969_1 [Eumeta japonica]